MIFKFSFNESKRLTWLKLNLGGCRVIQEYSSLFIIVIYFYFFYIYIFPMMHRLNWGPLCEPNFMYFCIKSSIGN